MKVVTRFPPSPTGYLHLGSARTALFNWLFARQSGGRLVLRIEDTDRARSTDEAVSAIFEAMDWLGLDWDDGPYFQTHRLEHYREVISQLVDQGDAYFCSCSPERLETLRTKQRKEGIKPRYDGRCRDAGLTRDSGDSLVVRFRNPLSGAVTFNDRVRGSVTVDNGELDDLVLERSDGIPTYNLAVVVDDMDMGITHVIRGDDHINNTPRQINILRALGHDLPVFAHVPMILGEDRKRLSKRNGDVSVLEYRDRGILPEALVNGLARLGWSHGDQEIFSLDELIRNFDLGQVNRAPAIFDMEKLLWVNRHHLGQVSQERLVAEIEKILGERGIDPADGPDLGSAIELVRNRAGTLVELADQVGYFYCSISGYDSEAVTRHCDTLTLQLLDGIRSALTVLEMWTGEEIGAAIKSSATGSGVRFPQIAQPLRIAVSGSDSTPPIDRTLELLGSEKTIGRIDALIGFLKSRSHSA
ncbi:MAG: glutamate--tRNA ligase [Gammaproteobacteria bacterium]|nr:glutamate--tRNA ligase [Gammaproteobacteria bacterium]MYD75043.1 glutamate--tRNA ligase [Gammaproteobacteria bacterium]MYJ51743.1 glutamate--tRNA ligase [Gammaproteobacteria bacterium]